MSFHQGNSHCRMSCDVHLWLCWSTAGGACGQRSDSHPRRWLCGQRLRTSFAVAATRERHNWTRWMSASVPPHRLLQLPCQLTLTPRGYYACVHYLGLLMFFLTVGSGLSGQIFLLKCSWFNFLATIWFSVANKYTIAYFHKCVFYILNIWFNQHISWYLIQMVK